MIVEILEKSVKCAIKFNNQTNSLDYLEETVRRISLSRGLQKTKLMMEGLLFFVEINLTSRTILCRYDVSYWVKMLFRG